MKKLAATGLMVVLLVAGSLSAASIDVGTHYLKPDQPGQLIKIYVRGGEEVAGMDLIAQIADGSLEEKNPGLPVINGADLVTNTIFADNNSNLWVEPVLPQVLIGAILTDHGTVLAGGPSTDQLLVTLEVDTTGLALGDGPWELKLNDTVDGPTKLYGDSANPEPIALQITDGWIHIGQVPEPGAIALLATAAGIGLLWRGKRRRTG